MRAITTILFIVIAVGIGALCVAFSTGWLSAYDVLNNYFLRYFITENGRIVVGLSGLLIVVLWLRMLLRLGEYFGMRSIVISETKEASSMITVSAIEEIVRKLVMSTNGVKDIRVKVIPGKRSVRVLIYFVLLAGSSIAELLDEAQNKVRQKLTEIIGTDKKINIKTEVRRITTPKNGESTKWEMQVPYREYT